MKPSAALKKMYRNEKHSYEPPLSLKQWALIVQKNWSEDMHALVRSWHQNKRR